MGFQIIAIVVCAFEMQSESPWLAGGIASSVFPQTHLSVSFNPACAGLLSGPAVSASASRPFGFKELDRTAVAGGFSKSRYAFAGLFSYSGRNGYGEVTAAAATAMSLAAGTVAGVSLSGCRIQIEGFGSSAAVSVDAGVIARPLRGLFLAGAVRGLYSSALSFSGMGAVPRTVSCAIGVCPVEGVTVAAGASVHQYTGKEFSVVTNVEPYPGVSLEFSVLSPAVRMSLGFCVAVSPISLQYGYSTHPELPGGHLVSLSFGEAGFKPKPLQYSDASGEDAAAGFPVNINTATEEELVTVPGIGPSRASTIRNYIEIHGPLQSIDQLINVPGIGATTFESLKSYLTVQ
jgi:comEA protein